MNANYDKTAICCYYWTTTIHHTYSTKTPYQHPFYHTPATKNSSTNLPAQISKLSSTRLNSQDHNSDLCLLAAM